MQKTLDVLIPHYNDVTGLELSIASIASQTWKGVPRVVVADDGSAPETKSALYELVAESPLEIVLLDHAENRGRPAIRNALLEAVESDFVSWLDAGDEWYPDKLNSQFAGWEDHMTSPDADGYAWVTCDYDWRWDGRDAQLVRQIVEQDQVKGLLVGRDLRAYLWTVLGTAESFRNVGWFDEKLPRLQDLDYFLRFVLSGGHLIKPAASGALCVYNKSDIGRNAQQIRDCNDYIFRKYMSVYDRYGGTFVRGRLFDMDLLSARFAAANGNRLAALRFAGSAARRKPVTFVFAFFRRLCRRVGGALQARDRRRRRAAG